jgi:hypothetical protein
MITSWKQAHVATLDTIGAIRRTLEQSVFNDKERREMELALKQLRAANKHLLAFRKLEDIQLCVPQIPTTEKQAAPVYFPPKHRRS